MSPKEFYTETLIAISSNLPLTATEDDAKAAHQLALKVLDQRFQQMKNFHDHDTLRSGQSDYTPSHTNL